MFYGKRELLESLEPYTLRPAPDSLPGKWMTGTQNHEGILGVKAAIDYLASLSRQPGRKATCREWLTESYQLIQEHEESLCCQLLTGLENLPNWKVWGITDLNRLDERVPTVSVTHSEKPPQELAERLAENGLFCWPGNHYALPFTQAVGLEPGGTLRIGLLHYNSADEVDRLLAALAELA